MQGIRSWVSYDALAMGHQVIADRPCWTIIAGVMSALRMREQAISAEACAH